MQVFYVTENTFLLVAIGVCIYVVIVLCVHTRALGQHTSDTLFIMNFSEGYEHYNLCHYFL